MKLKIKVTKDILTRAQYCSVPAKKLPTGIITSPDMQHNVSENCAIALAVRDIFPGASVGCSSMNIYPSVDAPLNFDIKLPKEASTFITLFDSLQDDFIMRPHMEPIEFEVDIPERYFEHVDITGCMDAIEKSETLEVVHE